MSAHRLKLAVFVLMAAAQLGYVLREALVQEAILRAPRLIKIRTLPVDPLDAFRGRYIALRLDGFDTFHLDGGDIEKPLPGSTVLAILVEDDEGFSRIGRLIAADTGSSSALTKETWLELRIDADGRLVPPFDRYYMNEKDAPLAEKLYRESLGEESRTWINVRVKNGRATIENLVINGVPFKEGSEGKP